MDLFTDFLLYNYLMATKIYQWGLWDVMHDAAYSFGLFIEQLETYNK